ncbi:hypothetical protein N4P33_04255 [Streptomyces sp. 15-116A]|uniref:hypothetical protein n=1 Tax=Streptomyces sp. 15-116A TaxID=2259035 RepID=UPI0021B35504|nr:hypothetical protein [Streptomyces sp. 15-116A]MCT7351382.1 hypothetical protein [Streptomyces sp. 15-116A]
MSTAPSPQPGIPHVPADGPPWPRRLLGGALLGLVAWGVAALLSPEDGTGRHLAAAALCAAAAVAVPYVLGVDRRRQEEAHRAEELTRRVDEHGAFARELVQQSVEHARHTDELIRQGEEQARRVEEQTRQTRELARQAEEHARRTDELAQQAQEQARRIEEQARRAEEHDRRTQDRLREMEGVLAETAALVRDGLRPPDRRPAPYPALDRARIDSVPELATSFAEALAPEPPILHTFVRLEMTRVVGALVELTNLSVECPGENHDWMLALTRAATRSICATSTSVDREFWNSEPATRYLKAQQEAIEEHDVPVRRLFLLESARELGDRLLRLCDEQEALDIEVRVAVLPELPPHLQRGSTNDFIVYDEEVSYEIEQDLRDVNIRTRLIARPDHVQDRVRRFRELWEASMSVRELEVRIDNEAEDAWMVDQG